jgi:hypothetical protein
MYFPLPTLKQSGESICPQANGILVAEIQILFMNHPPYCAQCNIEQKSTFLFIRFRAE